MVFVTFNNIMDLFMFRCTTANFEAEEMAAAENAKLWLANAP